MVDRKLSLSKWLPSALHSYTFPWSPFFLIDHDHGDDCDDADSKKTRIRVFDDPFLDLAYPTGLLFCFATETRLLLAGLRLYPVQSR